MTWGEIRRRIQQVGRQARDDIKQYLENAGDDATVEGLLSIMERMGHLQKREIEHSLFEEYSRSYEDEWLKLRGELQREMRGDLRTFMRYIALLGLLKQVHERHADMRDMHPLFVTGRAYRRLTLEDREQRRNVSIWIGSAIRVGREQDLSVESLTRLMHRRMMYESSYRARRIARTELLRYRNYGIWKAGQDFYERSGIPLLKQWHSTPDERTRGNDPRDDFDHLEMHGQVRKASEDFDVSGEAGASPLDPRLSAGNSIQCRCTHSYRVDREGLREQMGDRTAFESAWSNNPNVIAKNAN